MWMTDLENSSAKRLDDLADPAAEMGPLRVGDMADVWRFEGRR